MNKDIFRPGNFELTKEGAAYAQLLYSSYVLDAGCGTGATLKYLQDNYGCRAAGIDISPEAIEKARELLGTSAYLAVSEAESLPFTDSVFDAVFMECSLSLFDFPGEALSEAHRVLKDRGSLIIATLSCVEGEVLCDRGRICLPALKVFLEALGFSDIRISDRTSHLIQLMADAVFEYGSLDAYRAQARDLCRGMVFDCSIPVSGTGYSLILAKKAPPETDGADR